MAVRPQPQPEQVGRYVHDETAPASTKALARDAAEHLGTAEEDDHSEKLSAGEPLLPVDEQPSEVQPNHHSPGALVQCFHVGVRTNDKPFHCPTFYLFSRLPTELRHMVWEFAFLSDPMIVRVHLWDHTRRHEAFSHVIRLPSYVQSSCLGLKILLGQSCRC
jgi:hypothetical protein